MTAGAMIQTASLHNPTHVTVGLHAAFSFVQLGGPEPGVIVFFDQVSMVQALAAALAEAVGNPGTAVPIGEWL